MPRFADSVYGVGSTRGASDGGRRGTPRVAALRAPAKVRPAREWWAGERERVLGARSSSRCCVAYAESMKLSPKWAAEYRGFWDLPEDFEFQAPTPTVTVPAAAARPDHARGIGRPLPRAVRASSASRRRARGTPSSSETLEALLDERLARSEIRALQSGYKDATRFDVWLAVLPGPRSLRGRDRAPGRRSAEHRAPQRDGELVIRCDCGHDFCAPRPELEDGRSVVRVRDDEDAMREIYPRFAHSDPEWMELREFFCPVVRAAAGGRSGAARLPGGARLPAGRGGLLRAAGSGASCPERTPRGRRWPALATQVRSWHPVRAARSSARRMHAPTPL